MHGQSRQSAIFEPFSSLSTFFSERFQKSFPWIQTVLALALLCASTLRRTLWVLCTLTIIHFFYIRLLVSCHTCPILITSPPPLMARNPLLALLPALIMTGRLSYWVLSCLLLMHLLRLSNQAHKIFFPLQLPMQLLTHSARRKLKLLMSSHSSTLKHRRSRGATLPKGWETSSFNEECWLNGCRIHSKAFQALHSYQG